MTWNFDIRSAPHGRYVVQQRRPGVDVRVFQPEKVILATKCRKVLQSYYMPDEKRWMFLHHGEQPVAWMAWPTYPESEALTVATTTLAARVADESAASFSHSSETSSLQADMAVAPLPLADATATHPEVPK